jgi:ABC-type transport system involved in cytochrome bd biosynthesis fused ATPase/permease subunit
LKASDCQLPNFEKISSLIMPLGKTGVGKSTTIQLLTGATMVSMDGHIQADPEEIEKNPALKNIVCAKSTQSVTRYCQ